MAASSESKPSTGHLPSYDSLPQPRYSNLVAESDFEAVVKVIENIRGDSARYACDPSVDRQQLELLWQACQSHYLDKLRRSTQPVSNEAFHIYVKRNDADEETDGGLKKSPQNDDATGHDEDKFTFEEDELLDMDALQRVQSLRQQVRESSKNIKQLRDSILERSVNLAARQVELWVGVADTKHDVQSPSEPPKDGQPDENAVINCAETAGQKIHDMQVSLKHMMQALQAAEVALPEKLDSLRETVHAIQNRLNRPELSQTELAIISRHNEGRGIKAKMDGIGIDYSIPAEERLANMLRI